MRYIRQQFGRLIGWSPKDEFSAELPRFNKDMARQENFTGYKLNWNASDLSSGVYFVRAESAGHVSFEKLMLLK